MTRTAQKTTRTIERVQSIGGDEGCYAELHARLRSATAQINMMSSFLGPQETRRRLGAISRITKSLPWLHSEIVVSRRLREVRELLTFEVRE